MFDWLITILTPIVGAGAGTMFKSIFSKEPRRHIKEPPPNSLAGVVRQIGGIHDWQEEMEDIYAAQAREIRKLRRDIKITRYILDVFLVLMLLVCVAWLFLNHKSAFL